MKAKSVKATHPFVPSPAIPADHTGQTYCAATGCGLPRANGCHNLPDNPGRDIDQRRTGEAEYR